MTKYRSDPYLALRDKVFTEYRDDSWPYAKRWRNRVGFARLTAVEAACDALYLLKSINASAYRNDPELRNLLTEARAATEAFFAAVVHDNWDRYEGKK